MRLVPLSDRLGVELEDFDLARPRTPEEQAELREIFCEHHLIAIRGQGATDDDQTRLVGNFSPVHVVATGAIETYLSNRRDRMRAVGTSRLLWHNAALTGRERVGHLPVGPGGLGGLITHELRQRRARPRRAVVRPSGPDRSASRGAPGRHARGGGPALAGEGRPSTRSQDASSAKSSRSSTCCRTRTSRRCS